MLPVFYTGLVVIAHTCNNYDYDKNPKDHIKVKIAAAAAVVSLTALTHDEPSFPDL